MYVTYRMADRVAGVSAGAAADLEYLSFLPHKSVAVLHNPIPHRCLPMKGAISDAEACWKVGRGERILTVGSLKSAKNYSLLLRAFPDRRPILCLLVKGRRKLCYARWLMIYPLLNESNLSGSILLLFYGQSVRALFGLRGFRQCGRRGSFFWSSGCFDRLPLGPCGDSRKWSLGQAHTRRRRGEACRRHGRIFG